jgi:hypothetical protein
MLLPATTAANAQANGGCWLHDPGEESREVVAVTSSGSDEIDAFCNREREQLDKIFGVHPALIFHDGPQRNNALASPRQRDPRFPDGSVLIGTQLARDCYQRFKARGALPLVANMAHEWGHILQYKNPSSSDSLWQVERELSADAGAGWYLEKSRGRVALAAAKQDLISMFESIGNHRYRNFAFHGTPSQRRNAILATANLLEPEHYVEMTLRQALAIDSLQ